jgi:hypothetical protein
MKREYYLLIPNLDGSRLWLVEDAGRWALPQVEIADAFWWQDVVPLNRAAQAKLGCGVTTLGCLPITYDKAQDVLRFIYAVEPQGPLPEAGRWIEATAIDLSIVPWPEGLDLVKAWLVEPPAVPWYHLGWQAQPLSWAEAALAKEGLTLTAPIEQLRSWERSALWRLTTAKGAFYFKAVSGAFVTEPTLTRKLAEWPDWFAPVLAVDAEQGWMLLGNAGNQSLLRETDAGRWAAALHRYAEMQVALSARADDLLTLGVVDRRVQNLPGWIEALLADTAALTNSEAGLSVEEIERLRAKLPEVLAACKTLGASPIPPTLEHGDFAPGQVVYGAEGVYRFIDWSDAGVSFPFLSMLFYWAELGENFTNDEEMRVRFREAYLEAWAAYASKTELVVLYEAAMAVAPFYYALIYYREILPQMVAKWEMKRMLPYYLRLALKDS